MGRIKDKNKYTQDSTVSLDDYFIGSDFEKDGATKTYSVGSIFSLFKSLLSLSFLEYRFSGDFNLTGYNSLNDGYFETNGNETSASSITSITINKNDLRGTDITGLINVINQQPSSFVLKLSKDLLQSEIFYFSINSIVDNLDDTFTLSVTNFIGNNSLVNLSNYGIGFELSGVPSVVSETDPVFSASPAGGIGASDISNWNTAFGWGDHSAAGYQDSLNGTGIVISTAGTISYITNNSVNWNTAFGWGDHSAAGYLTSFTETDPVFSASPAGGITSTQISQWDVAYSWGDHSAEGYILSETDPVFSASPAGGITLSNINNWNSAYSWGDHSAAGYLTQISGTFTPTLHGSTSGQYSTSFASGSYVKIGKICTVEIYISGINGTTPTGDLEVRGIPFNAQDGYARGSVLINNSSVSFYSVVSYTTAGTGTLRFHYQDSLDGNMQNNPLQDVDFTGGIVGTSITFITE